MPREEGSHRGALRTDPPAVDETDLGESTRTRLLEVLLDDRPDIARGEGMQVE